MSDLQPHQQRVVDERAELNARIGKLDMFIDSNPVFEKLSDKDQELLKAQRKAMQEYSGILSQRILLF
ncbi:crAss001_48 related protein [Pseudomonas luteola]